MIRKNVWLTSAISVLSLLLANAAWASCSSTKILDPVGTINTTNTIYVCADDQPCPAGWPDDYEGWQGLLDALHISGNRQNTLVMLAPGRFYLPWEHADYRSYIGITLGTVDGEAGSTGIDRDDFVVTEAINNVRIVGQGTYATEIVLAQTHAAAFEIGENVNGLELSNMQIRSCHNNNGDQNCDEGTPVDHQAAISPALYNADYDSLENTSRIKITGISMQDLNIGIQLSGGISSSIKDVFISRNHLERMTGYISRYGLGINTGNVQCARITKNYIKDARRHSIYQSWGQDCAGINSCVLIDNNMVVDPGHGQEVNKTAIAVARSNNVSVAFNTVIGSHTHALSAEEHILNADNIHFIGNKVIGRKPGVFALWVNTSDANIYHFLNTDEDGPLLLFTDILHQSGQLHNMNASGTWFNSQAITEMDGTVYIMQGNTLHKVASNYGSDMRTGWTSYNYSTTDWSGFQAMQSADGYVYVMQSDYLHRVAPAACNCSWSYTYQNGWGTPFNALSAPGDGYVYLQASSYLYRINPANWSYSYSPTNWTNTQSVNASLLGRVYVYQNGSVHEVAPGGSWPFTIIQ